MVTSRRGSVADSIKKSFDATNVAMVWPVGNHLEISDDISESNSIDDIGAGWFVWLVAATASIAGSLFGYDTGLFSLARNLESLLTLSKASSALSWSTWEQI
jgi:SP family myo-inositol transporter-like MFS transporter 13